MKQSKGNTGVQLSLFDDMRNVTDNELIQTLTNKDIVSEQWCGEYRLERLFNSLTPHRRKIAMVAVELYKRKTAVRDKRKRICDSQDVFDEMEGLLSDIENEEFWLLPMNQANRVIERIRMNVGGISETTVDVRLIMRKLLDVNATSFIVVHNHPSGNRMPSIHDDKITNVLKSASNLFNIKLLDHLIIAGNSYYSFSDEGRM